MSSKSDADDFGLNKALAKIPNSTKKSRALMLCSAIMLCFLSFYSFYALYECIHPVPHNDTDGI